MGAALGWRGTQLPGDGRRVMSELAPNWAAGQGLTWSGRWHIITEPYRGDKRYAFARCGTLVYANADFVPSYVNRLLHISKGHKAAPMCKKCERAAQ